jgi:hypothetical protein
MYKTIIIIEKPIKLKIKLCCFSPVLGKNLSIGFVGSTGFGFTGSGFTGVGA